MSDVTSESDSPAVVVFDLDGVVVCAKTFVDRDDCLQQVLCAQSQTATSRQIVPGSEWRAAVRAVGQSRFVNDPPAAFEAGLELASNFLAECLSRLEMVYQSQGRRVIAPWISSALDFLTAHGCRVSLCSGTILEETIREVELAGVDISAEQVYGYPVRKMDLLNRVCKAARCDRSAVCLVDDSEDEVVSAREQGFAAIQIENLRPREADEAAAAASAVRFHTTAPADSLAEALSTAGRASRGRHPNDAVRAFLGDDNFLCERAPTRFDGDRVWHVRRTVNNESFYCKRLRMRRRDADQLGEMVAQLAEQGLPVPPPLTCRDGYAMEHHRQSIIMERALAGRALADDRPSDFVTIACARTLAQLHCGLRDVGPPPGSFRADFSEGLDSIDLAVDSLWKLLIYFHYQAAAPRPEAAARLSDWVRRHGRDALFRLELVRDELQDCLPSCVRQWVLGDFNYSNVLWQDDAVSGVVDYEDVHFGPRELDVAAFCMYGARELHWPTKLDVFVSAYDEQHPARLNHEAVAAVVRAIANVRLARQLRKLASLLYLEPESAWLSAETTLNHLDQLCKQLSDFTLK